MNKILFKWKHWYWYYVLFANFGTVICLTLDVVLMSKNAFDISAKTNLFFLAISAPILMTFFLVYCYKTNREFYICKSIIKVSRYKFFQLGFLCSVIMFNFYIFLWFISYKTAYVAWIYLAIAINVLCGLGSTVFFTLFEFCTSFDVFYAKNKNEIVHDFLEKNLKKLSKKNKDNN